MSCRRPSVSSRWSSAGIAEEVSRGGVGKESVAVDRGLRFVRRGLECEVGVSCAGAEYEQVFRDAQSDSVSPEQYDLFSSPSLHVTGRVDDLEPGWLWMRSKGLAAARKP